MTISLKNLKSNSKLMFITSYSLMHFENILFLLLRSNQKYFDNVQFNKLIRELAANLDIERPFLALNLRSILLNLSAKAPGVNIKKKQPES